MLRPYADCLLFSLLNTLPSQMLLRDPMSSFHLFNSAVKSCAIYFGPWNAVITPFAHANSISARYGSLDLNPFGF
jgi:hypothetical protein